MPRSRLGYKDNKGPDLFTSSPDVWIEAAIATSGTGNDALQQPESGTCIEVNPDNTVLRLRNTIDKKSKKFCEYIKSNIVQPGQATIIAISGLTLPHSYKFSGLPTPEIVRAVYPVNYTSIDVNLKTGATSKPYLEYRNQIEKLCGSLVSTEVFLDPDFAFISAALYSEADTGSSLEQAGVDFILVHNTNAVTPLPIGWMPIGREYWWKNEQLYWQNHND